MSAEKRDKDRLQAKYGRYMTAGEELIREFNVGFYKAIATNKRIIFLRKFPNAFIPIAYNNITNIEHYVYIPWDIAARFIVFALASVYAILYLDNTVEVFNSFFSFIKKNIPELSALVDSIPTSLVFNILVVVLPALTVFYLLKFILSLFGKLKISVKASATVRIDTPLTADVRELIKLVEASMEGNLTNVSAAVAGDEELITEDGCSYLVKEYKPDKTIKMVLNAVVGGCTGIYISRTNPEQVKKELEAVPSYRIFEDKIHLYWLTDSLAAKNSISPEPDQLFAFISDFLEKNSNSVVLLDGLEYLISHANFEQVLRFVQGIKEKIGLKGARFIIIISPQALSGREMALLERDE